MSDTRVAKNLHVMIVYRNHRGEVSEREIIPGGMLRFASTEWHKERQWLLDAFDVAKGDKRTFAVKDIIQWRPFPIEGDK